MKNIIAGLLLICLFSCNNDNKQNVGLEKRANPISEIKLQIPDSLFQYHFKILDSVSKHPPLDTMYNCCHNSVNFMEENTGISADVDGDYFGATGFKRNDLQKWHQWYDSVKFIK